MEKAETKLSAMKVPTSENTNDVDDELADFMINLVQNNDTEKKKVKVGYRCHYIILFKKIIVIIMLFFNKTDFLFIHFSAL